MKNLFTDLLIAGIITIAAFGSIFAGCLLFIGVSEMLKEMIL